jgi:hypothetical protein
MAKEEEHKSLEQKHKESLQEFYAGRAVNTGMSTMLEALTGQKIRSQDIQVQMWIQNNEMSEKPARRQQVIATLKRRKYQKDTEPREVKGFVFMDVYVNENNDDTNVWLSDDGGYYKDADILAWMPYPGAYEPPE